MAYDIKKERSDLYRPGRKPEILEVDSAAFIAIDGSGDPNVEDGDYYRAVNVLYAVAYTIRMAPKAGVDLPGYAPYVVPPLEGFWWMKGGAPIDYAGKQDFQWVSCIRLPDFASEDTVTWACEEAERKKGIDCSAVRYMVLCEGLCVQAMHIGPYDDEPHTIAVMNAAIAEAGYVSDFRDDRLHHEIYLSDPRRTAPEKLKTIIRHPIRPA